MKVLDVPRVSLGKVGLEAALASVFGPDMLRRMHGPSLRGAGPFDAKGKRAFKFSIGVQTVPAPIRRFFCGSRLRITTRQTLDKEPGEWTITNKLKLHFLGAEFFKIRPVFWLREAGDGEVTLGGRVRHDAMLPPPLCHIAEGFMALNSEAELRNMAAQLAEAGVIPAVKAPEVQSR